MDTDQFWPHSQSLHHNLEADNRVIGLVFFGSSAEHSHLPDQYSDHDFYLITTTGTQEEFRQNVAWLPDQLYGFRRIIRQFMSKTLTFSQN